MDAATARFYVEGWKAVEEVERQELRSLSMETRLQQMNMIWQLGKGLGFSFEPDESEMKVFMRWAKLKEEKMTVPEHVNLLIEPLMALQRLLDRFGEKSLIIGGIAVGFLGKPRFTADLDAMFFASIQDIPRILEIAKLEGITPRIEKVEEFAQKSRVLLMRHTASGANIDISLGALKFEEEAVERGVRRQVGALSVRLPTPEDLIIFKAVAHRPKDLEDIRTIVDVNPNLDLKRIQQWVEAFAEILALPDLWKQIEKIIKMQE